MKALVVALALAALVSLAFAAKKVARSGPSSSPSSGSSSGSSSGLSSGSSSGPSYTLLPIVYGLSGVGNSVLLLSGSPGGAKKGVTSPLFVVSTVHHVTKLHEGGVILAHSGLGGDYGVLKYG
ncbi:hypothetical protein V5799_017462 [Amblyomma americanum]|uniref:Secreted protein n=1 Tax=Amblyomma americanum TaxID=6943 RepID=A0AAQ4F3B7_AMBAM